MARQPEPYALFQTSAFTSTLNIVYMREQQGRRSTDVFKRLRSSTDYAWCIDADKGTCRQGYMISSY